MQDANHLDSGVYQCKPDNAPPAKIKVHILDGGMFEGKPIAIFLDLGSILNGGLHGSRFKLMLNFCF